MRCVATIFTLSLLACGTPAQELDANTAEIVKRWPRCEPVAQPLLPSAPVPPGTLLSAQLWGDRIWVSTTRADFVVENGVAYEQAQLLDVWRYGGHSSAPLASDFEFLGITERNRKLLAVKHDAFGRTLSETVIDDDFGIYIFVEIDGAVRTYRHWVSCEEPTVAARIDGYGTWLLRDGVSTVIGGEVFLDPERRGHTVELAAGDRSRPLFSDGNVTLVTEPRARIWIPLRGGRAVFDTKDGEIHLTGHGKLADGQLLDAVTNVILILREGRLETIEVPPV